MVLSLLIAFIASGCVSPAKATRTKPAPQAQAEIERRLLEIFDAAAKKEMTRLDSYHLYGPKFTKFSASSPDRQDAEAARQGEHTGLSAIENLTMRADSLQIDVFGNVAVATFILDAGFRVGEKSVQTKERSTLVFVKANGEWRIAHEHFSPIR